MKHPRPPANREAQVRIERLFAQHERQLERFAKRLCGRTGVDYNDVVGEYLFKVMQNPNLDNEEGFMKWSHQIIVRCFLTLKKGHWKLKVVELTDLINDADSQSTHFVSEIMSDIELEKMLLVIDQCTDSKTYAAFVMHYLEGRTFEEIAQALERPVGTIKSSIFRANVRIYRKLTSQQLVNAAA